MGVERISFLKERLKSSQGESLVRAAGAVHTGIRAGTQCESLAANPYAWRGLAMGDAWGQLPGAVPTQVVP